MREALAKSDLDFVVSKSDDTRRKGEPTRFPKILRVASIATAVLFCGVIVVNALFLQDRKHAAPLLRAPDPVEASPTRAAPAAPIPAPPQRSTTVSPPAAPSVTPAPTRSSGRDAIADEINRVVAATAPERKPAKPVPAKSAEDRHDPIAGLIGTTQELNANVLAAQKALVRLGYVLRADGVYRATTRQAIQSYERDNKLPVRGELTPKLTRDLIAKAGSTQ